MKTSRIVVRRMPASASWRATPLPQSMTYVRSPMTMALAGAAREGLGVGPPAVPRRIRRDRSAAARTAPTRATHNPANAVPRKRRRETERASGVTPPLSVVSRPASESQTFSVDGAVRGDAAQRQAANPDAEGGDGSQVAERGGQRAVSHR